MPSKPHPQEEKKPIEDRHHLKQRQRHDEEGKPRQERERLDRTERQRKASQDKDRDRDRERDRDRDRERDREERGKEKEKEEEKMEEEVREGEEAVKDVKATKLLDELFRKTKATPCIYWLPLTDDQVRVRINLSVFSKTLVLYRKSLIFHV